MRSETVSFFGFSGAQEDRRNVLRGESRRFHAKAVAAAGGNRQIERTFRVGLSFERLRCHLARSTTFALGTSLPSGSTTFPRRFPLDCACRKREQDDQQRSQHRNDWTDDATSKWTCKSSFALERADYELGGTGLLTCDLLLWRLRLPTLTGSGFVQS